MVRPLTFRWPTNQEDSGLASTGDSSKSKSKKENACLSEINMKGDVRRFYKIENALQSPRYLIDFIICQDLDVEATWDDGPRESCNTYVLTVSLGGCHPTPSSQTI
jgi:hypothetical protein